MKKANRQTIDSKRRTPKQTRARDTLEVIFDATARVIEEEGRSALNTNRVAERAGISIGTLYQYFANKEAILCAMARRELEEAGVAVMRAISGSAGDPVRLAIRALISAFEHRREVRRIAMDTLASEGFGAELGENVEKVAQMLAAESGRLVPGQAGPIPASSLFVLTRAVNGVLRAAAQEESPYLGTEEFEDNLVRLVQSYLGALRN